MKSRTAFLWALAWMLVTATTAWAATYQAEVITDNVRVRSGPNMESYACTSLDKGDKVIVVDKRSDDWLMIKPPPIKPNKGCFSVIVKEYVEVVATNAKGQPLTGKVTGDNVRIKAAGDLRKQGFYAPQGTLSKGTTVKIIGLTTDVADNGKEYYVIKPPAKVRFFIASRFVKPVTAKPEPIKAKPVKVEPAKAATTKSPAKPEPPPTKPDKTSAEAGMSVGGERAILKAVRALEKKLVAETKKTFEKQDFPTILAGAKKLNVPPTSRFRPQYDSLIIFAEDEIKLAKHRKAADLLVAKAMGKPPAVAATVKPKAVAEQRYDIQGILGLSVLYSTGSGPRRYILRNPETKKIVGYAQSAGGLVNLDSFVGRHVGIRGKAIFDKTHSLRVHEAEKVALIQPGGMQVARAEPPVTPTRPTPVPTTPVKPAPAKPTPVPTTPEKTAPAKPTPVPTTPEKPAPAKPTPVPTAPVKPVPAKTTPKPVVLRSRNFDPIEPAPTKPLPVPTAPVKPAPAKPLPVPTAPVKPAPAKPTPVPTAPVKPAPAKPTPVPTAPVKPAPAKPTPVPTAPVKPAPAKPTPVPTPVPTAPVKPAPTKPTPVPTAPVKPAPAKPTPIPTAPVKPAPTKPLPVPTAPVKPAPAKPTPVPIAVVQPVPAKPVEIKPSPIETPSLTPTPIKAPGVTPTPIKAPGVKPTPVEIGTTPAVKPAPVKVVPSKPAPPVRVDPPVAVEPSAAVAAAVEIEVEWD